jgi:hypothetical protein
VIPVTGKRGLAAFRRVALPWRGRIDMHFDRIRAAAGPHPRSAMAGTTIGGFDASVTSP